MQSGQYHSHAFLSSISLLTSHNHSDVCTKYQEAAKIVNLALQGLVSQCVPGAKVLDLCEFGHTVINTQASKLFTKKVDGRVVDRGVAFPVCISVNDIVCNFSPLPTEETVRSNMVFTCCFVQQTRYDDSIRPVLVNPSAIRL